MANRYWVGGTAAWDGTAGTKWALTSGGAGGQPIPTSADDVFFDVASGASSTITISTGNTGAKSITCTGFTGRLSGTSGLTVSGNVTLSPTMLLPYTGVLTLNATATLTTAGISLAGNLTCTPGAGNTITLGDALTMGTGTQLTITNGTFTTTASNYSVTVGNLASSNANTRTVNFNSSIVTITGTGTAVNFSITTGLTLSASGSFRFTSASSKSFLGGGLNYGSLTVVNAGSGALTITGSNTFGTISNSVQPAVFSFTAGTTTTVTNWSVSGTAGNLVTIQSATAATHTLSKASGTVSSDYLSITNSIATGGATWYAGANSTNVSGNTGWIFTAPPSTVNANFFMFM